ncbi:coiled-coil domain-containing protein 28A isoform X2 [Anabrus simplex]|uniref:coiled-coil domain-containing protein 28A isoform X2 n=1 Tax=Anabrus simplex TaxID=316456 RepID=UPI0034DD1530
MAEGGEECELEQLVPADDDSRPLSKSGEVTPPVTPGISKVTQTSPTSPISTKISSTGGSVRGVTSHGSTSSQNLNRPATAPTIATSSHNTPGAGSLAGRALYLNEKLSRGLSLTSDSSGKQNREQRLNPAAARLHNTKRDVTDVRRMETALLHLLEDFHSGKLRAFGKDCSMEQMTAIREQQERLARLHFDLGAQQELFAPLSDEGLRAGQENMQRLMESLEQLSVSIERLHSFSSDSRESSLLQD